MNRPLPLLLILLLLATTPGRSQQKLFLSATVVPTFSHTAYNYRYLFPESDGQVVEPVYLHGSRWASGASVGASVLYEYTPGWSVASGLWYQQLAVRQTRDPSAGPGTVTLNSRAIRVPVLLNYTLFQEPLTQRRRTALKRTALRRLVQHRGSPARLSPCFTLGMFVDMPLTGRVVVRREGEATQQLRLKTLTRPIFHGLLGAGAQYDLTERVRLVAQPTWTYTFGQLGGGLANSPSFELSLLTQVAYSF